MTEQLEQRLREARPNLGPLFRMDEGGFHIVRSEDVAEAADTLKRYREAMAGVLPVLDGYPMTGIEATQRIEALRQALSDS